MRRPVVAGLLLAAGAGRRMGGPKALVELDGEPLVLRALRVLGAAGLDPCVVVLGAQADAVAAVVAGGSTGRTGGPVTTVVAEDWGTGMGASLRAGLASLAALAESPDAALVHLVDTPGIGPAALARVAARAAAARPPAAVLARGAYAGRGGHPVLLGAAHWDGVRAAATGDAGARGYLAGADVEPVEVGDVADPADLDTPADLAARRAGPPRSEPAAPGRGPRREE